MRVLCLLIGAVLTWEMIAMPQSSAQTTVPAEIVVRVGQDPKPISPDLFGIFFEDINYAADGGLYAELIQNRSFEYRSTEQRSWNEASFWELVTRGEGAKGGFGIGESVPVHPNNPHYAVLDVANVGDGVGLMNGGFDGIPVKAGETYDVSIFAKQLYMNARWGGDSSIDGRPMPVKVRLETKDGTSLGETSLQIVGRDWKRYEMSIVASKTESAARFVLLALARGGIALDEISLFPRNTFRNRKNGLRADLAQVIADLKPRFIRFPGGCLAHGNGIGNIYRWKDTIGPVEQRKQQANLWGYHQTAGLGYFEYFQFCEDIGAKPLPVVAAGVSCQNSGHVAGVGQQRVPMQDMPAYVQDVLDLIEWANGPADSAWGAKRAAAGHPEPFKLEYLGIGNEDHITPEFRERFKMIFEAAKAKHPEIKVIGTVGPFASGEDFDAGWKLAGELRVPIVDEHYYVPPDWFWNNLSRYDAYDRSKSHVYVGEYAAHDDHRKSTLRAALAEAAYLTSLERNGDVGRLSSYAPLLAKQGHTQWRPDLIYFDNTTVSPTINYHVQKVFSTNAGDACFSTNIDGDVKALAISCVRESKSGDVILKIVSRAGAVTPVRIDVSSLGDFKTSATCATLSGDPMAENEFGKTPAVEPTTRTIEVAPTFSYEAPAHSLNVVRISTR